MDLPSATTVTSNQDHHLPAQRKVHQTANLNTNNDGGNLHSKTKTTANAYVAHIANLETKLYNRAKMEREALALTHKIWNDQEREKKEAHEKRLRDSALQYSREKEKRENRAAINEEALQTLKSEREEHSQFTQQMHQKELEQSHRQKLAEYARRLRLELKREALEEKRTKRIEEEEKKKQYKTLAIQQKIENAQERLKRETAEKIALLKQQSRTHSGKREKLMNCRRSEECKAPEVRRHSQEHSTARDSRGCHVKNRSSASHQNTWAQKQMVINKLVEKQKKVVREEFEQKIKIKETKWKDNDEKVKALNKTILGSWAEKSAKREALRAMHLEKHSKNIKEYIASKAEQSKRTQSKCFGSTQCTAKTPLNITPVTRRFSRVYCCHCRHCCVYCCVQTEREARKFEQLRKQKENKASEFNRAQIQYYCLSANLKKVESQMYVQKSFDKILHRGLPSSTISAKLIQNPSSIRENIETSRLKSVEKRLNKRRTSTATDSEISTHN